MHMKAVFKRASSNKSLFSNSLYSCAQGRVHLKKPVNANAGLKVNLSNSFHGIRMFYVV